MTLKIKTCEKILEMNKKRQEFESALGPAGEKKQINKPQADDALENDSFLSGEAESAIDV